MANAKKSGSKKKLKVRDVTKARKELTKEMAKAVKGGRRAPGANTIG